MDRPRGEPLHLRPERTGKSHLAETLVHAAIDKGKTVAWHTLESLATLLRRHRADNSVSKAIGRLIRADLIVIDDIGMLPVAPDAAEALFRVVDRPMRSARSRSPRTPTPPASTS
jgi:DNA replication protein DnaC